jgi:WD40 repeat protein
LRIYDVKRGNPQASKTFLEPFPADIEGEVNSATFSPDGILLALGRNDNHTHVYDSRMLNKLLFDYEHYGPSRTSPGSGSYGVVQVQWVESDSKRLPVGLVTGGNDGKPPFSYISRNFVCISHFLGCVRFWDPLRAAEDPINGRVLVETNSDIGHFSLGDYYLGERDLVVCDTFHARWLHWLT